MVIITFIPTVLYSSYLCVVSFESFDLLEFLDQLFLHEPSSAIILFEAIMISDVEKSITMHIV